MTDTAINAIPSEDDPRQRPLLTKPGVGLSEITETVSGIAEMPKPPRAWYVAFAIALSLLGLLGVMLAYLIFTGVGVWGNNNPVFWGWPIVNFVFWVGIGHAGTLISAILFLTRQNWRTGVNRFAEAMTIFAVCCAAIFPGVHIGRVWLAFYLFPLPNQMSLWPNFRSPLLWDVFAVGT
ncbi:MAG: polysulfide reductase NrfD, partial [Planctomycetes bacterium]|nr:polysulfide reductase NrfD [Planctomycetota bacterium]